MSNNNYSYKPDPDREQFLNDISSHLGFKKNRDKKNIVSKNDYEDIDRVIMKKLDESDPHQQAQIFNMIKRDPPNHDFMKIECHTGCNRECGNKKVYSKSIRLDDGTIRWIEHDPFFEFSPYDGFKADIAAAPLHVMGRMLDEKENVEFVDKKAHMPEKRTEENKLIWWVILIGSIVGGVALLAYQLFGG